MQTLATRLLVDNVAALRAGGERRVDDSGLLDALAAILADATLEPAFVAPGADLPSEADIAREIGRDVDPDAIFRARAGSARAASASSSLRRWSTTYRRLTDRGPYSPDAASAGRRALQECLPRSAGRDRTAPTRSRAPREQYQSGRQHDRPHGGARRRSRCTTCRSARPRSRISIARYHDDPLIIDKWLALQATIPEPATLDRVQGADRASGVLVRQSQPRARADRLLRAGQPTQFNRADGAGYDFVAETVLALDPKNPQVAARLLTAFKSWRALEAGRRAKAQAALAARRASAGIVAATSSDIVPRALAGD